MYVCFEYNNLSFLSPDFYWNFIDFCWFYTAHSIFQWKLCSSLCWQKSISFFQRFKYFHFNAFQIESTRIRYIYAINFISLVCATHDQLNFFWNKISQSTRKLWACCASVNKTARCTNGVFPARCFVDPKMLCRTIIIPSPSGNQ